MLCWGFKGGAGDCGGESAVASFRKMQNVRCSSHKKYKCIAFTVALQEHPVPMPRLIDLQEDLVSKLSVEQHACPPVQFDFAALNASAG